VIADNRLAELAGWDRDLLAIELQALAEIDLGFDLEVIGFETAEIDLLIVSVQRTTSLTDMATGATPVVDVSRTRSNPRA